jgi:hypothetical protein
MLCGGAVTYGHLGALVDASYGLGIRRRCGGIDDVWIGGPPRSGLPAIFGLNEGAQRALTGGRLVAPGMWLAPIRARVGEGENLAISQSRGLPHRDFSAFRSALEIHELAVPADSMLAIAHRATGHHPFRAVVRAASGRPIEPVYRDMFLELYVHEGPIREAAAWRIEIEAVPALIDVLVVERPRVRERAAEGQPTRPADDGS